MFMLIKNVEKPKLPKLVWALRKQFGPETLESDLWNLKVLAKFSQTKTSLFNNVSLKCIAYEEVSLFGDSFEDLVVPEEQPDYGNTIANNANNINEVSSLNNSISYEKELH